MRNENRSPRVKVKIERGQFYVYAQLPYIPSFLFTRVNKEEEETGLTYISYDKLNSSGPRAWTISHNYFRVHLFRQRFVRTLQPDFWGEKKEEKETLFAFYFPKSSWNKLHSLSLREMRGANRQLPLPLSIFRLW